LLNVRGSPITLTFTPQRWAIGSAVGRGGSIDIRIPKRLAESCKITDGQRYLIVDTGKEDILVLIPVSPKSQQPDEIRAWFKEQGIAQFFDPSEILEVLKEFEREEPATAAEKPEETQQAS